LRGPQGRGNLPPHYALITPAQQGTPIGLISEAGLPGVADPGADIVAAAHELHIPVVVLPGPSSITLAVAASGLQGQSFAFVGYLPQDAAARAARIRALENLSRQHQQTQLMIETPYRNAALAQALVQTLSPTTRLSISCGLTLPRGWTRTQTVSQWRQQLAAQSPSGPAENPHSAPWPDKVPTVFALLANP
jgi:16S rRNA (cytidine1402-2'-O)-methyltransferase